MVAPGLQSKARSKNWRLELINWDDLQYRRSAEWKKKDKLKNTAVTSKIEKIRKNIDPKMFPGDDPKLLQSLDPKTMDALMDPKMLQTMEFIVVWS